MTKAELKKVRKWFGHSQFGMACAIGVALRTYQGWEYGKPIPQIARNLIEFMVQNKLNVDAQSERPPREAKGKRNV